MKPEEQLINQRIESLEELKKSGINPYPYFYNKDTDAVDIQKLKLKKEEKLKKIVNLAGRIISIRNMGKSTFGHLQDQTGKVQFYIRGDDVKDYKLLKRFDIGDFIGVKGNPFKTKAGENSIWVKEFVLLAKSLRPLPDKWYGLKDTEIRYRQRYVDLIINPEVKDVFIKRARIYQAIREFLDKKGFIEIQTPIIQTQYGGGSAKPFSTKIHAWDINVYLRIAYELHLKRLIVGGFEKIYDLSSCFRNEGIDRTHNPEFAMMEIQWAFVDYTKAMELTEQLWEYVAKKVLGTTEINYQGTKINLKAPWKRMTVKEALRKIAKIDVDKLLDKEMIELVKKNKIDCKHSRGEMIIALFEELCESRLIQPTHIIDHPRESAPLARFHREDKNMVERIEPYINGWEVGNCYTELTDPILQKKLFEEQAKKLKEGDLEAHPMDEDYIRALEHGLPPNTGIGIGVDRMVMLLTDSKTIRDVILFPTMRPENK